MPSRPLPIVLLSALGLAATLGPATPASGDALAWSASSGLVPHDPAIPQYLRFAFDGEASFLTLASEVLEVDDSVRELRVSIRKDDVTFTPDGDWAFEVELRMIAHARQSLDFGAQLSMHDGARMASLGIARDAIGFVDSPSTQWIPGSAHAMDTTDAAHVYRVEKTGAADDARLDVYVDGNPVPVITLPYASLAESGSTYVLMTATSIIGTARFDVHRFAWNTDGTDLTPCLPDVNDDGSVDFGDVLAILSAWGETHGREDLDGSGVVDFGDLLQVLAAWGACP